MLEPLTIEAAEARIARRREKEGILDRPPPPHPLAAGISWKYEDPKHPDFVDCFDCHTRGTWSAWKEGEDSVKICERCFKKRRAEEIRNLPARVILADAGIGERYWRFDEDRLKANEGGWPKDVRRHRRLNLERWSGEPKWVTLSGRNGNGKTTLAVELARRCYRKWAYRDGAKSLFMIRPRHLFDEQFSDERPRTTRALRSPVTILDEAFAVGEDTENRIGVVQDFLSARWERSRVVTIITTNRRLSKQASSEAPPIETICRSVFDRMTDGVLCWLQGPSMRGR